MRVMPENDIPRNTLEEVASFLQAVCSIKALLDCLCRQAFTLLPP